MRRLFLTGAVLLPGACAEPDAGARPARVAEGEPVPAYGARTLAGDSLSLASLRGSPVLLNIWATWCPPCREEMPSLQRLHEDFADRGLRLVAVSVDNEGARDAVAAFVRDYGIGFTILHDPAERIGRVFRTIGVPETFLIDREGRLVRRWIGEVDADAAEFRRLVEATVGS